MKKILIAGFVFALFTTAASAQSGHATIERQRIETGQLARGEKFNSQKGDGKYRHEQRKDGHDRKFRHGKKGKFHHMRHHHGRKGSHMKHNQHRRKF
jgi:hypothetical protein